MSDSLKTNYLSIGHHLTVNEDCNQPNHDLKSDQSPSDLEKNMKLFF